MAGFEQLALRGAENPKNFGMLGAGAVVVDVVVVGGFVDGVVVGCVVDVVAGAVEGGVLGPELGAGVAGGAVAKTGRAGATNAGSVGWGSAVAIDSTDSPMMLPLAST